MAELLPGQRLQPSLLDRLTNDTPESKVESREKRVMSMRQLRAAVLRDLGWLLNTPNKDNTHEFDNYPEVRRSVLNFGMPDYTGLTVSMMTSTDLEREIREAIEFFEPRIVHGSLRVSSLPSSQQPGFNSIALEVAGEVWAQPVPEHVYLRTEVDLETGQCRLQEGSRG
ncbi:MAG: type VI secretion system baseplate subunit TssE [Phycisphaeraceae bacterium]|nr:type VI secretion system baseplate subunit TssE [Phycisphaeraceae bacterium]MCW5754176.1 type VI secretion system baseplate subunit TssE [Phycisphaeraceae bacterium]